jgi:hypothetical protein
MLSFEAMNPRRKLSCCPESAVVFEQVGFDFMVSRSIAGSLSRSGVAEVMAETAVFGKLIFWTCRCDSDLCAGQREDLSLKLRSGCNSGHSNAGPCLTAETRLGCPQGKTAEASSTFAAGRSGELSD